MKKFLKKRWLGLPVAVILSVVLLLTIAGGAFASYYTFFNGGATLTVNEAISWGSAYGDPSWNNSSGQWTVTMYPGETKNLYLYLSNASSVVINVYVDIPGPGDPALSGTGWYAVPAGGGLWVTFSAVASSSIVPGTYTYTISMSR
jgi:hypothetical protein